MLSLKSFAMYSDLIWTKTGRLTLSYQTCHNSKSRFATSYLGHNLPRTWLAVNVIYYGDEKPNHFHGAQNPCLAGLLGNEL